MFVVKEKKKNGRHPNYSYGKYSMGVGQEAKNKKFSKEKNVSPKERHIFSRKKGMNDPSRRTKPTRFIIPPTISLEQEWNVVQHKKFLQKLTKTKKRRMRRQRTMEKRQLNEAPKEALKEKTK